MKHIFEVSRRGAVSVRVLHEDGRAAREFPRVLRMADACRVLGRSRRHLYRYVARGWLRPVAKFSGEFFFDVRDLRAICGSRTGRRAAVPAAMAPLFPEYDVKTLEPVRDADVILSRILERGTARELSWAVRRYPLTRRRAFLRSDGRRLLSARAHHFWSWLWGGVRPTHKPSWRDPGLAWGGVS
jgi:hypothetical protein